MWSKRLRALDDRALYFTRSPCPVRRGHEPEEEYDGFHFWQHIGVYAYRRDALRRFCSFVPSPLESLEKLEQLRALENGMSILLCESKQESFGIDTEEDLERAQQFWQEIHPDL